MFFFLFFFLFFFFVVVFFLSADLFYAISNDVNKFCDGTSSTLVERRDSVLKEIVLTRKHKLYFPQKLLK